MARSRKSLLTQTLIVHIARTNRVPFVQSCGSRPKLFTTAAIMCTSVWLPISPFAHFFGFGPLPPAYSGWLLGFLAAFAVLTHRVKTWFMRRFGLD